MVACGWGHNPEDSGKGITRPPGAPVAPRSRPQDEHSAGIDAVRTFYSDARSFSEGGATPEPLTTTAAAPKPTSHAVAAGQAAGIGCKRVWVVD